MPKAVGVRQLKARLSEYLRLVKSGETVLVTDRDEVVAELRPAHRHGRALDELEDILDALAESGEVTRADTSAVLRTSRLALVESARAIHRLRVAGRSRRVASPTQSVRSLPCGHVAISGS